MANVPDADSVKMFIGQIPKTMEEKELKEMLEEFGPVYQTNIIRDKTTAQHRGCAFVTFYKRKDAIAAQTALHGIKIMPGVSHPIQMKPAEGQNASAEDRKLFVGMLPKSFSESDVAELFAPFGTVEDCSVLRDSNGQSKGCAFLLYTTRVCAQNAIRIVHHSRVMEGCRSPIVVKFADTQKDKDLKRMQNMQQQQLQMASSFTGTNVFNSLPTQLFGQQNVSNNNSSSAAAAAAAATVNPLAALAALGSLGLNATQLQQVVALAAVVAPVLQSGATALPQSGLSASQPSAVDVKNMLDQLACSAGNQSSTTGVPLNGAFGSSPLQSYSTYGALTNAQAMSDMTSAASGGSTGSSDFLSKAFTGIQQFAASFPNAYSGQLPSGAPFSSVAGSQMEGPEGANLFIYNLPEEFRDNDMLRVFLPFGTVVSAKVFIDKLTGQSKCFGFVSYESPSSAQTAIQAMNGFLIGSKRLKVQLKRPKNESKPY
jgi:CUG-BP- and ETR3-like factor